jgi:ABC-type transport system involved in multi-copper enzyme maturation permease subunit
VPAPSGRSWRVKVDAVLTISRLTVLEASRRKVLWAAIVFGFLFLAVYALGFHFARLDIERSLERGTAGPLVLHQLYNFFLLAGLYAANFLVLAMGVLTSVATLSGEIPSGTIQTVVAKPVPRWTIVIGKWLGLATMLTLYFTLLMGGTVSAVYVSSGYMPPNATHGAIILWLNAMLILTVSLCGGTYLSTLANGAVAFGLFGVSFVGGWVEHIGSYLGSQLAIYIGTLATLAIPTESLWRRAAYLLQSPLVTTLGVSPFTSASIPSQAVVWYAVAYSAVALTLAIRQFARRDL